MSKPAVSIIVPIYNAEKYLHRCVDSLINQSLTNIEILLINDGSTDDSAAICERYAANDCRIKVFHRTNHGVAATRQFGLEHVSGIYVIHADPDDWVDIDMYERMYNTALREQSDLVISDYIEEYGTKKESIIIKQKPTALNSDSILTDMYTCFHGRTLLYGSSWNKLVRTDIIRKYKINFIQGYNISEDRLFFTRLLNNQLKVSYCPNTYYHYDLVTNMNSLVRGITKDKIEERIRIIKKLREYQTSDSISNGIINMEIYAAYLALCNQVYSKDEYIQIFKHLKGIRIFTSKYSQLQFRLIAYTSVSLSFYAAQQLIILKFWYRNNIKRIKD